MNIQARKLHLIEEFLKISDENIIEKLEHILRNEKMKYHDMAVKPMSVGEFHEMIDQAKLDKANDRVISHQKLKNKVKSWK